jgi:hypothetical protein
MLNEVDEDVEFLTGGGTPESFLPSFRPSALLLLLLWLLLWLVMLWRGSTLTDPPLARDLKAGCGFPRNGGRTADDVVTSTGGGELLLTTAAVVMGAALVLALRFLLKGELQEDLKKSMTPLPLPSLTGREFRRLTSVPPSSKSSVEDIPGTSSDSL